jgi:phage-related protein
MAVEPKKTDQLSKQSISQLANIDWDIVASYIEAGVTAVTIADKLGIERTTLYNRCKMDKGITYSTFARQKKSTGKADLQLAAHRAALSGEFDPKYTGALIFALKSRLGLSDRPKEDKGTGVVNITVNKGDESNA